MRQSRDEDLWSATLIVFALLSATVLSMLLVRDWRATSTHKLVSWCAVGIAGFPLVVHIVLHRPSIAADLLATAGVTTAAILSNEIGGLGFLVSALFLLVAATTTLLARPRDPQRRPPLRTTGRVMFIVVALLMIVSVFDAGGAALVAIPVGIPLLFWARAMRNAE